MKDFVDDMDPHNEQWIEGEGKSARIFIDETENDPADDIISSVVYIKLPFSFLQEVTIHKRDTANIDKDVREKPIHSKVEETATKNGMHTSLEEAESKNTNQEYTSNLQDPDDEIDLVAGEFWTLFEDERGATELSSDGEAGSPQCNELNCQIAKLQETGYNLCHILASQP